MSNIHPDVFKRYAEGKCTSEERRLVEEWLEKEDDLSVFTNQSEDPVLKHAIWAEIREKATQKQTGYKLKRSLFGMVAAILLVAAGAFIFKRSPVTAELPLARETYEVPKGKMISLVLNDGTQVQLAGGSSFQYPRNFPGHTREVTLISGEAFFKVKHNPEQPFIVHSSGTEVKVLGTRFNVSNVSGSNHLAVTLTQGSISFKSKDQVEKILIPGQKLTYDKILNKTRKIEAADTSYTTSWTAGILWFKQSPVVEVIQKLEAYYGVTFKVEGTPDLTVPLTGKFKRQPLSRILKLIENSSELKFKQEQNTITIYKAK
ncbi:ferric-dicitrate binding protein FerR (iron transport regulator) [Pedobacter cryoconitis]|uniref:FecR family protein n=1 Tax=Pedobacter cryoconitis TaxID=188932 RepID=UPI00160CD638|nr:FecR family protein [Pedobacter cryoconitis]MBB6270760.1 ferric-dicitrate binding protein FerR (iron transport regulator) [Pedobacter cryoconitis]